MPEEGRSSDPPGPAAQAGLHRAAAPARDGAFDAALPGRGRAARPRTTRSISATCGASSSSGNGRSSPFFLIVVVATAIGTLMQTPIYRAEITLKIESEASKIIPFKDGVQFDTGDPDYFQTQLELLKSRALAERVVAQMKLKPAAGDRAAGAAVVGGAVPQGERRRTRRSPPTRPTRAAARNAADGFRGGLGVAPVRGTKLVRVSYASANPQARGRPPEFARAELHQLQPRAALRRVDVRQDVARGEARRDQGQARDQRARADRVPARQRDRQRRRPADRAVVDAGRLQRRGQQGRAGAGAGRGALRADQDQSRKRRRRCSRARPCRR